MHLVAIGGSDPGISAALRARELDPSCEVTVVLADDYPNFSICGLPYYVSGDVPDWHNLAHRTRSDLEAAGLQLRTGTRATAIATTGHSVELLGPGGRTERLTYDALVIGTGAVSVVPPIAGLTGPGALGPADGTNVSSTVDIVLVVVGVRPDSELAKRAGARLGVKGAVQVDTRMSTNLPDVYDALTG